MSELTKNEIKARLKTIASLKKAALDISKSIAEEVPRAAGIIGISGNCDAQTIYEKMEKEGLLDALEEGEELSTCTVEACYGSPNYLEISRPLLDGGKFVVYTGLSDFDTRQAGIVYYDKDKNPMDLSMVEVVRGELANRTRNKENNEDISLHVWTNPYSEDCESFTLEKDDIDKALRPEEFEENHEQ